MEESFSELWSSLRERRKMQTLNQIDAENDLKRLSSLVDTPDRQSLSIAEWISVGASLNRNDWVTTGLVQFATLSFDQKKIALDSIGDLSLLGNRMDRWAIIEPVLGQFIADSSDPAINYVNTGDISLLKELTESGWKPAGKIPTEVDREIRIQVGWRAIDEAKKVSNLKPFQDFFASKFLGTSAYQAPREWEFRYLKAFFALINGDYSHAKAIIENTIRRPDWSRSQLALEARRIAFFAIDDRDEWLHLCSNDIDEIVAGSDEDLLLFRLLGRLARPSELRPSIINELRHDLRDNSWLLVLIFLIPTLRKSARSEIAKIIHSLDDQSFANLRWEHCKEQFGALIGEVDDPEDVLPLAIRCYALFPSEKLKQFLIMTFAIQDPESNVKILSSLNTNHVDKINSLLPEKLKSVIARGNRWIAVVDASNVLYCGVEKAQPELKYLKQALSELKEAGFSKIIVFLDSRTLNVFNNSSVKAELTAMQKRRELSIVSWADPLIIKEFLTRPFNSEIISCDKFRDLYDHRDWPQFKEQIPHTPMRRREYFRNQKGVLEWKMPLDRRVADD